MVIKISLFYLIFAFCLGIQVHAGDWIRLDVQTLFFDGDIGENEFLLFKNVFDDNIHRLIVRSNGGQQDQAVLIGDEIFRQKVDVYVSEYCYSACANFLFLPAANKFLMKTLNIKNNSMDLKGYVCFHGGGTLGTLERINQGLEAQGIQPFSSLTQVYSTLELSLLGLAQKGEPQTIFGFTIRSKEDYDRYLQWRKKSDRAADELFYKTGASPRLMTLFYETNKDWVCPTNQGFKSLGVSEVEGEYSPTPDLIQSEKIYIFNGILPEDEPSCKSDLKKLKENLLCNDKENISCLRQFANTLSPDCRSILGMK